MVEVYVIAEGQTEERFIKDLVAPAFRSSNVFIKPIVMNTSATSKGGAITVDRLKFNLRNSFRQHPNAFFTTFLDLYGLDSDFPSYIESRQLSVYDRVNALENALNSFIVNACECRQERFFSYIQPHEFEGLLFSDVNMLVSQEESWSRYSEKLVQVRNSVETPEHINDGYETKPSKRLEKILREPKYHKTRHGALIAKKITLDTIQEECPHFRGWITKLRSL